MYEKNLKCEKCKKEALSWNYFKNILECNNCGYKPEKKITDYY